MAADAAIPGLFFTFAAMVLLIFVSRFLCLVILEFNHPGTTGFSICTDMECSLFPQVWRPPPWCLWLHWLLYTRWIQLPATYWVSVKAFAYRYTSLMQYVCSDSELNDSTFFHLTRVLILIPIGKLNLTNVVVSPVADISTSLAAGLSGLAFLFGLCGAGYHRVGTILMSLVAALAMLVTLVAWVIEMVLFGIIHHHLTSRGEDAHWGNANWLVLGALVSLFIGWILATCGIFGRYRSRRTAY
jgi:hypothetical protein